MTVRFLVDAMLPPKFVRWLNDSGFDARRSTSLGVSGTSDEAIWQVACKTGEIIISRDKDFIELSHTSPSGKVILYRQGNSNFAQLVREFENNREMILSFAASEKNLLSLS